MEGALDVTGAVAEGEETREDECVFQRHAGAGAEVGGRGVRGVAEEGDMPGVVGGGGGVFVESPDVGGLEELGVVSACLLIGIRGERGGRVVGKAIP